MYVVNYVFYVINVALPLTQCIGYNCGIKYLVLVLIEMHLCINSSLRANGGSALAQR